MNWSDVVVVIVPAGIGQAIVAPPGDPDHNSSSHDAVPVDTGWVMSRRVD